MNDRSLTDLERHFTLSFPCLVEFDLSYVPWFIIEFFSDVKTLRCIMTKGAIGELHTEANRRNAQPSGKKGIDPPICTDTTHCT